MTYDSRAMTPDLSALLEHALALAVQAGGRILEVYESDFAVTRKGDESPLTAADLASHKLIVESLRQHTPELPCLSEEGADIPYAVRSGWSRYWLIDPLDGTREFINRNGEIHAPVTGATSGAAQGLGAFKVENNQRVPIATRRLPATPTWIVSRSHAGPETQALIDRAPKHEAIGRGSSLKFCLVAEGSADFYPRFGPTSEWDTAAGQCIVEQAGGAAWRLPELTPLACNEKESVLNPSFAVVGDPRHDWAALLRG
jgi:3'(2'), 5'-bisphosphate nucleotidase